MRLRLSPDDRSTYSQIRNNCYEVTIVFFGFLEMSNGERDCSRWIAERTTRRFVGRLLEMIVVMMLGMCVLGVALGAFHKVVFGSAYADAWRDYVVLAAFAMAFNMTVPMVLWMRYRGHSWERGGEMAAAMILPLLPLLVLYSLDVIAATAVLGLQMMLMIPAMVLAMLYRREEYSAPHTRATGIAGAGSVAAR